MGAMGRCDCGGVLHMAEGGHVKPTIQELERMAGAEKAAFRTPMVAKRREDRQDRQGAADAPLSVTRGMVAGALGLPGDLEKIGRAILRNLPAPHDAGDVHNPVDTRGMMPNLDDLPFFRQSEGFNESLPLRAKDTPSRAAMEGFGNLTAPGPTFGLVKNAPKIVKGVEKILEAPTGAPLSHIPQAASQTGAIRVPGLPWADEGQPRALAAAIARKTDNPTAKAWTEGMMEPYIRDKLGSTADPLLKNEAKNRLHLQGYDLKDTAMYQGVDLPRVTDAPKWDDHHEVWNVDAKGNPVRPSWENPITYRVDEHIGDPHTLLTGRPFRTAWENVSDKPFDIRTLKELYDTAAIPKKVYEEALARGVSPTDMMTSIVDPGGFKHLGLGNVPEYLQKAMEMRYEGLAYGGPKGIAEAKAKIPADQTAAHDYLDDLWAAHNEGHILDPEQLQMTMPDPKDPSKTIPNPKLLSLEDAVRRTSLWDRYADRVKMQRSLERDVEPSGIPAYENHEWKRVTHKGADAEGKAMRHCVGSYCAEIEEGDLQIYSLRDKNTSKPVATIELHPPDPAYQADPWGALVADHEGFGKALGSDRRAKDLIDDFQNAKYDDDYRGTFDEYLDTHGGLSFNDFSKIKKYIDNKQKESINQIKGFANEPIKPEHRYMIQDFLNNQGDFASVKDQNYAGLTKIGDRFWQPGEYDAVAKKYATADFGDGMMTYDEFLAKRPYNKYVHGPDEDAFNRNAYSTFKNRIDMGKGQFNLPDDWKYVEPPKQVEKLPNVDALPDPAIANPFAGGLGQPLRGQFERRLEEPDDYGMRDGGRVGYAIGGSIGAPATVGLGTFATGNGGQTGSTVGTGGLGNPFAGGYGLTNGTPAPAPAAAPVSTGTGAMPPTYDLNTLAGQMYLSGTLNMGGAGQIGTGVNAFLGNDYQPTGTRTGGQYMADQGWDPKQISYNLDPLLALGDKMGYKSDVADRLRGISGGVGHFNPDGTYTQPTEGYGENTWMDYQSYNAGLNDFLKNYVNVSGMSPWAGKSDPRAAASTLYQLNNNVLTPAGDPNYYHAREHGSWAQENQDGVMAAAILGGGFLGGSALAAGGAGGAGAGAGAGWGSTAANAVGLGSEWAALPAYAQAGLQGAAQGALTSGVMGGDPLKGALMGGVGGIGGSLGSAGASYFNPELAGLGKYAGSMGAKYFANQATQGKK